MAVSYWESRPCSRAWRRRRGSFFTFEGMDNEELLLGLLLVVLALALVLAVLAALGFLVRVSAMVAQGKAGWLLRSAFLWGVWGRGNGGQT